MTRAEVDELLAQISALWPHAFPPSEATSVAWHHHLAPYPARLIQASLDHFTLTANATFAPSLSVILHQMLMLCLPPWLRQDAASAWGEVHEAAMEYGQWIKPEVFQRFSPLEQRLIHQIGWYAFYNDDGSGVLRGQFLKMYEINQRRALEEITVHPAFRAKLAQLEEEIDQQPVLNPASAWAEATRALANQFSL